MNPPDYRPAAAITAIVADKQRGTAFEERAAFLKQRLERHQAEGHDPARLDRAQAIFDCMFSSLQIRSSRAQTLCQVGRSQCEWCGSSVKVHESSGPDVESRRTRVCRACGVRSEAPAGWEPSLAHLGGERIRIALPGGEGDARLAGAAVVTTGERVARRHVFPAAASGGGVEMAVPLFVFRRYLGCPVFLRIAVVAGGRQAVLFGRGRVGGDGRFT
ncbi:MAG TPA: hypothetical protein VF548_07770 [Allosphingosinicella sp.]|jgi:hypothetical protein